jgi:hypothetical protein
LRKAALELDTRAAADMIEKIIGVNAQAGLALQTLAQEYRYDRIAGLVDEADGH